MSNGVLIMTAQTEFTLGNLKLAGFLKLFDFTLQSTSVYAEIV